MDRQRVSLCTAHQTAGHLTADPRVLIKDFVLVQSFFDILQVHLTAVDRCRAVQLSNQTADISISFSSSANGLFSGDLGVDQTDILQLAGETVAAKGLEQSRVAIRVDRQIVDRRGELFAGAFIAFELSVFDGRKFPVIVLMGPA